VANARTYTSSSLWSDLGYCFRIRATNANGTGYGPGPCAVTRSSGQPNPTVKRLQLRVKIADVSGAGTDDPVEVWLGTYDLPGDNRTGLNYAPVPVKDPAGVTWHDDFARNRERTFDLVTTNIATLPGHLRIQIEACEVRRERRGHERHVRRELRVAREQRDRVQP
jgi:hypothetical protein